MLNCFHLLHHLQSHKAKDFELDVITVELNLPEHLTCVRSRKYGALPATAALDTLLKRSVPSINLISLITLSFCVCNESFGSSHHFC